MVDHARLFYIHFRVFSVGISIQDKYLQFCNKKIYLLIWRKSLTNPDSPVQIPLQIQGEHWHCASCKTTKKWDFSSRFFSRHYETFLSRFFLAESCLIDLTKKYIKRYIFCRRTEDILWILTWIEIPTAESIERWSLCSISQDATSSSDLP